MHDHVRGIDANDNQPMTTSGGAADWTAVEIAAGDGDAGGDVFLKSGEAGLVAEAGRDAVAGQGLDLGRWVRCVSELADTGQVLIVAIGPSEDAGIEEGQEHGAAGGEAHPPALIGGGIQLGEPGH